MIFTKKQILDAVVWMFGFTKKQANEWYRKADEKTRNEIRIAFENNAARSFYHD